MYARSSKVKNLKNTFVEDNVEQLNLLLHKNVAEKKIYDTSWSTFLVLL